jgi:hypothetical protein
MMDNHDLVEPQAVLTFSQGWRSNHCHQSSELSRAACVMPARLDKVSGMTRDNDCRRSAPAGRPERDPVRRFGVANDQRSGERVLDELRQAARAMFDPSVPQHLAEIVRSSRERER